MKTRNLLIAAVGLLLVPAISLAQDAENSNPYAIFGRAPYVAGEQQENVNAEKVFVIENAAEGSEVARMEHNPQTGHVKLIDKHGRLLREKLLKAGESGWLTQDRFAEKYYSLSPYSFVGGNPINRIDMNGDSIWYTIQDNIVTMHITAKVINYSSEDVNVDKRAGQIAKRLARDYSGTVTIDGQEYQMVVDANIEGVESISDVAGSDHLFAYADRTNESIEGASNVGGKAIILESGASLRGTSHEFGHAAGLQHPTSFAFFNLMSQGSWTSGSNITSNQRAIMYQQRRNINKYPNSAPMNPYIPNSPRIPYPYLHNINTGQRVGNIGQVGLRYNYNRR